MRKILPKLRRVALNLGALAHRAETTDGLVLLLVMASGWWMAAQQGGRAEALPVALRLMLGAVTLHGVSLLIRRDEGIRVSLVGLAFAPFVAWLAIDAAVLAPDRGPAIRGVITAAMVATAWHLVLHHARRTWSYVGVLLLVAAPASILAVGAFDLEDRHMRGLLGALPNPAYAGHFISAMGSPGACAAVMLLGLMPALAILLNPLLSIWKRAVSAYFAALVLLGLVGTHHAWAWVALAAGLAAMIWSICESNRVRASVAGATALAAWMIAPLAQGRFGVLRALPADTAHTAWLGKAAWSAFAGHPVLGGGAGSFPLDFESIRPPAWQTDPASCGSLPLQVLSEHGTAGVLLLLVPAICLIGYCLRRCFAREALSAGEITAQGGRKRAALRRSLAIGATTATVGGYAVLSLDYPGATPGVLLLLAATGATAFRLSQDGETGVLRPGAITPVALTCLAAPALLATVLVAPLESGALSAPARETVARFSPQGLASPGLLKPEAGATLSAASRQLEDACALDPLDGEGHAWLAQSLALLVRQSPRDEKLLGRALSVAETATRLNPRSPWTRAVLGSILLGSADPSRRARGLAEMRLAAAAAPMNQSIALRLAQAVGQSGAGTAELRDAYERAQLTNPTRAEVREKVALLRSSGQEKPRR